MERLVERARELLRPGRDNAVMAASLRSSAGLREHLSESFGAIREQMDGLVMSRRIRLED